MAEATTGAPRRGQAAEQLIELAHAQGLALPGDADLAQVVAALTAADLQSPIPLEAFAAVAELLVQLYRANNALAAAALAGEARR